MFEKHVNKNCFYGNVNQIKKILKLTKTAHNKSSDKNHQDYLIE